MDAPEVRYTKSGDISIAYAVVGDGPFDLVFIVGRVVSTLEFAWDGPPPDFVRALSSFSRLILFDKWGAGLSDRAVAIAIDAAHNARRPGPARPRRVRHAMLSSPHRAGATGAREPS